MTDEFDGLNPKIKKLHTRLTLSPEEGLDAIFEFHADEMSEDEECAIYDYAEEEKKRKTNKRNRSKNK